MAPTMRNTVVMKQNNRTTINSLTYYQLWKTMTGDILLMGGFSSNTALKRSNWNGESLPSLFAEPVVYKIKYIIILTTNGSETTWIPRSNHWRMVDFPKFPVIRRRDRRDEMSAIITSCADCWTDKRMLMRNLPGDINRWSAWQNRTTAHCCWVKGCSLTTTDMMETHRIPSLWKTKWNRDALLQNHRLCSRRAYILDSYAR